MNDLILAVAGPLATLISTVLWLPQASRTWQVRKDLTALMGGSVTTPLLVVVNALTWGTYALAKELYLPAVAG